MLTKTAQIVYQYWNRLRDGQAAPLRRDFDPAALGMALPDIFILDMNTAGEPIFRLAGTAVCAYFAKELKGDAFCNQWAPAFVAKASALAGRVVDDACPACLRATGRSLSGDTEPFEMLLLPMRSDERSCDLVLGVLVAETPGNLYHPDPLVHLTDPVMRALIQTRTVQPA